jgi:hypothetical protein
MSDKWYPGKFLGKKKPSSSSPSTKATAVTTSNTIAPPEVDNDKWYPGKFAGRADPSGSQTNYQIAENDEEFEVDSSILSIRRGKMLVIL